MVLLHIFNGTDIDKFFQWAIDGRLRFRKCENLNIFLYKYKLHLDFWKTNNFYLYSSTIAGKSEKNWRKIEKKADYQLLYLFTFYTRKYKHKWLHLWSTWNLTGGKNVIKKKIQMNLIDKDKHKTLANTDISDF